MKRALFLMALLGLTLVACGNKGSLAQSGFVNAPVSDVASQVAGRVQTVLVREGEQVKKGQVLAQLDSRERAAEVAQAQANLNRARKALAESEANLRATQPTVTGAGADIAKAEATLDEAQSNFDRTQKLVQGNAATKQQLDSARARLLEARAQVQSLTASKAAASGRVRASTAAVDDARAGIQSNQAAVDLAKVQLAQATILAPFDGVVVNLNLQAGEWAAPGTAVVTMEDLSRMWVRLDVGETQFQGLKLGLPVKIHVVAIPGNTFDGNITQIGAEGEFAVNQNVKRGRPDIRTFRVRASFDQVPDGVIPGMTAEVQLGSSGGSSPSSDGGEQP